MSVLCIIMPPGVAPVYNCIESWAKYEELSIASIFKKELRSARQRGVRAFIYVLGLWIAADPCLWIDKGRGARFCPRQCGYRFWGSCAFRLPHKGSLWLMTPVR